MWGKPNLVRNRKGDTWRSPVVFMGIFVLSISGMKMESVESASYQPNIIVIVADDMGWNDVSFHGADQIPTPNIDALAYNGVILNRHYVLPSCTPSRTAYLTGSYPIRTGMQGYPLAGGEPRGIPLNVTLLPEHLQNLGYRTSMVGKWHVGYYTDGHTPANRGFDSYYGYYNGLIRYSDHVLPGPGNVSGIDFHKDIEHKLSPENNSSYVTDVFTNVAVKIIENHDTSEPLYLHVAHVAPHAGPGAELLEVKNLTAVNQTLGYIDDIDRRKYAGLVTSLDQSVGQIVKALGDADMLENSVILFMTDNGAPTVGFLRNHGSNYPYRGLKFTLYEGGVHGAACIFSPLIEKSSRVTDLLLHVTDWLPTFYSLAGGDVSDLGDIDGVDQWSAISQATHSARDSLLVNVDEADNLRGVVSGTFKLIKGAVDLNGHYYGDSGNNASYPEYNYTAVLESDAGEALSNIGYVSTRIDMITLRLEATITCDNFTTYDNCSDSCLFDLVNDPCETTDVSAEYPEIFSNLSKMIETFESELVPQTNTDVDPASYPEHFNGFWMPWLSD